MQGFFHQTFAYLIEEKGIKILRCFSQDGNVVIPEQIEGQPVRALGPYAFSEGMEPQDWEAFQARGGRFTDEGWRKLPQLKGGGLSSIVLPPSMEQVGAYCFYNCDSLQAISFPSALNDWGRGAFTGCHHVKRLEITVTDEAASCLKEVLSELHEEVEVIWRLPGPQGETGVGARLLFPEYFEEGVENTPARILVTMVHGSGLYYRNCFQGRRFDFQEYDARFAYAQAQEDTRLLVRLAYGRLRNPLNLRPEARLRYLEYLSGQLETLADMLLQQKSMDGLEWLCQAMKQGDLPIEWLESLIKRAAQAAFPAGLAYLMDFRRSQHLAAGGRRRMEL